MAVGNFPPGHDILDVLRKDKLPAYHLSHSSVEIAPIPLGGTQRFERIVLLLWSANPNKAIHGTITTKDLQVRQEMSNSGRTQPTA